MSDAGGLQLEKAEFGHGPGSMTCARCRSPFSGDYFEAGGHVICGACAAQLGGARDGGSFLLGALAGAGAAALSAAVWWGVRKATGMQLGLLAVGVGYFVGKAVRVASRSRGGLAYQLLAVFLVYNGIVFNYLPDLMASMGDKPVSWLRAASVLYGVPFRGSPIGMIILGIALWEAWKMNRPARLTIRGPFQAAAPAVPGG